MALTTTNTQPTYPFLQGGGELGELTRQHDWSQTVIGTPDTWPQSLRTTVGIILNSRFPMFLWWGQELIQFYNDAYRPSLGNQGKHPAVGQKGADSWVEIWPIIKPMIDGVMAGGEATWHENQLIPIYRNGQLENVYWTFSYSPVLDEAGQPGGVLVTCQETTGVVAQTVEWQQNKQQLDHLFSQVNAGIAQTDPEGHFIDLNDRYCQMLGYERADLLQMRLAEVTHPDDVQEDSQLFARCVQEGTDYLSTKRYIRKDGGIVWVNNGVSRVVTGEGRTLITAISIDMSATKAHEQQLIESENKLRSIIAAAPAGIGLFVGRDLIIEHPNQTFIDIVGKGPGVEGIPLREAMPELLTEGQPFLQILDEVFTSGEPFISPASLVKIVQNGVLNDNYYNISYTPVYNAAGQVYAILDIAIDVTDQIKAQQALAHSEAHLQLLRDTVPAMIFYLDASQRYQSYNRVFMDWFKVNATAAIGKTVREFLGEQTYASVEPYLEQAYAGQPTRYELYAPTRMNTDRWLSIVYTPHQTEDGEVIGVIVLSTDITQQVVARQKAQESEESLRGAIELAAMGTWEWNIATGIITYSALLKRLFEFSQDFIDGDQVYNPIQEPDRARVAAAMARAAIPEFGGLLDEEYEIITQQTSRHRIVRAQGKMYFDASGQPRKMLGSMRDVTQERQTQLLLEQLVQQRTEELAAANEELAATNEELEAHNEEYTALNEELEKSNSLLTRSNDDLQKFAYIASHDLQEPLRKIQQFGDLLRSRFTDSSSDQQIYLERMQSAASRMSSLIRDLLDFSRVSNQREVNQPVPLTVVINRALTTLELVIEESGATITVEPLPTIMGDASQLDQLFQNLLSNALKFRQKAQPPRIQLSSRLLVADQLPPLVKPTRIAPAYHQLDVADNGVGFDEKYLDRIFQVFQRLYGRNEYAGTGIGLAICEKVVANHGGAITASSQPGQGATFSVFLPIE